MYINFYVHIYMFLKYLEKIIKLRVSKIRVAWCSRLSFPIHQKQLLSKSSMQIRSTRDLNRAGFLNMHSAGTYISIFELIKVFEQNWWSLNMMAWSEKGTETKLLSRNERMINNGFGDFLPWGIMLFNPNFWKYEFCAISVYGM